MTKKKKEVKDHRSDLMEKEDTCLLIELTLLISFVLSDQFHH